MRVLNLQHTFAKVVGFSSGCSAFLLGHVRAPIRPTVPTMSAESGRFAGFANRTCERSIIIEIAAIEIKQGASRIGRENGGRLIPVKVNLFKRDHTPCQYCGVRLPRTVSMSTETI